jgi:hypothetical protein
MHDAGHHLLSQQPIIDARPSIPVQCASAVIISLAAAGCACLRIDVSVRAL